MALFYSVSSASPHAQQMPGAGLMPKDGQIVATILKRCNGKAQCASAAWNTVEVQRCRGEFPVPGGCFGPKGAIMKVINQTSPQYLRRGCLSGGCD